MIEDKKNKIKQLAAQESPKLKRSAIAAMCQVSPAYVSQTLGPSRPYVKKRTKITEPA